MNDGYRPDHARTGPGCRPDAVIPAHLMAGLAFVVLLAYAYLSVAGKPVSITVNPMIALSPAVLTIQVHVPRNAENRMLRIEASDQLFVSEIPLDGEQSETVFTRTWTATEEGSYVVAAGIFSATELLGSDRVRVEIR